MREGIDIACGATEAYLPHLGVMLRSMLIHTRRRPVRIWFMHEEGLPAEAYRALNSVVEAGRGELRSLLVPRTLTAGLPASRHFHSSVWHRIFLPELLPDRDRVLYLDADMVITDDLEPLWDTDLQSHYFGAVVAPLYPFPKSRWPRQLGLQSIHRYFSSGVLLMDLATMRERDCIGQIRRYAKLHPENTCPEQDALNALFERECLRLHPRWNVHPPIFELRVHQLPFSAKEVREARSHPAVVHFAGVAKPWLYLSKHPLRGLYFRHLRKTPWPRRPLEGATARNRALRLLPVPWQYAALHMLFSFRQAQGTMMSRLVAAWRSLKE